MTVREWLWTAYFKHPVLWFFVIIYGGSLFIGWYFDGQTGYGIGSGDMR